MLLLDDPAKSETFKTFDMIRQKCSLLACLLALTVSLHNVCAADPALGRLLQKLRAKNSTNHQQLSSALNTRLYRLRLERYPAGVTNSSILEFPWLVTANSDNYRESCAGVLIAAEWALVPATCAVGFETFEFRFSLKNFNPKKMKT